MLIKQTNKKHIFDLKLLMYNINFFMEKTEGSKHFQGLFLTYGTNTEKL